ncbi:MAG TPA: UpxY family transcription antiterminator [Saprospiraceae bacterium]|nr:UpxY family transcription antiterminator [Saprospiraceae bacterium]
MIQERMTNVATSQSKEINHLDSQHKRWFAVYTKYKCEKYVSELLNKKEVNTYLPLQTKLRRYTRKIKKLQIPLINNYVFVQIKSSEYITVLETEYIYRFVRQGKNLISIPENEIDILKRIVGDIESMEVLDVHSVAVGEEVEVISGQLTGLRGKIVSKWGKKKFVVELKNIGYLFHVQMDLAMLRPLREMKVTA